jgi:predicted phosphodiesterase
VICPETKTVKRVAALYDIHGNLPALEAVLDDARRARVDHVVVGGDVVPGPMPAEVIRCLLNLDIPVQFIQGNGEVAVLAQMSGRDPAVPAHFREVVRWVAQQLHSEEQGLLASWPKTLSFHLPPLGEVLFCHATPRNEYEIFTRLTPAERLLPIFEGLNASVVVCGHTHIQFDRTVGKIRVVNAGSVGMPFGEPGAYWALLGANVELRRTAYDLANAAALVESTNYPQADDFAANNILQPRSEEQMLQAFSRAELK